MYIPTSLPGHIAVVVVEVFIIGFQKAIVQTIGIEIWTHIGSKQNAILILNKKFPRRIGLSAKFTQTCGNIDVIIRTGIQHASHPAKILAITTYMRTNESGIWMSIHEIEEAIHDSHERWKWRAGKSPIRM